MTVKKNLQELEMIYYILWISWVDCITIDAVRDIINIGRPHNHGQEEEVRMI